MALYLVQHGERTYSTRSLYLALDIHYKYLGRLMKTLTDAGFLIARRGKTGGYRLAAGVAQINLHRIIEELEGLEDFERCILGLPECSETQPCVMHQRWSRERERIKRMFATVSLIDLAARSDTRS